MQESDLAEIGAESTPFGRAVKRIVSGPEVTLPAGYAFRDHKGDPRTEVRLAWWRNDAATYREAALSVPDVMALPDVALPAGVVAEIYPSDAAPVLVGDFAKALRRAHEKQAIPTYELIEERGANGDPLMRMRFRKLLL